MLPGLGLAIAIAAIATVIGSQLPVIGSAIPAVVMGVVLSFWARDRDAFKPGVKFASKFILQCSVVLLGAKLSLQVVWQVGLESLPVMLASLTACLLAAFWIGRLLGTDRDLKVLIGVGTGICGASAIAAVAPVIKAKSNDISYAISTIFVFNLLAIVVFPPIGHALGMSAHSFGLFAGTAVNDTSSVVATAGVYSSAALGFAVVVKLVRTLMIIPISVGLAVVQHRQDHSAERFTVLRAVRLVPWFLVGFLIVVCINSTGVVTEQVADGLTTLSVFGIATALAGIGMSTDLADIRRAGTRPLLLGALLWVVVAVTSLATMTLTGQLR